MNVQAEKDSNLNTQNPLRTNTEGKRNAGKDDRKGGDYGRNHLLTWQTKGLKPYTMAEAK